MTIITISRQFGSGGDEVAELVCKRTGYQLFDKHLITRAALAAGLSDQEVVDFSESNYKVKNFLTRLFGGPRPAAQTHPRKEGGESPLQAEVLPLSEENALALMRKAIESACELDHIVIVGRGGQAILRDEPNVLHVRVEAPLEDRILRVRGLLKRENRSYSDSVEARRAAQDLIETNDAASADYLKRFYKIDWSDPMLYHIILNTGKLNVEQAALFITGIIREMEGQIV